VQKFIRYKILGRRKKGSSPIIWEEAPDIALRLKDLTNNLEITWITVGDIFALRSSGSKSRAIARIWGLSKVWQMVLKERPKYIIEVISERFDRLPEREKNKVLLHEIAHIPKNFSGALVPHYRKGKNKFSDLVDSLVTKYLNAK
jgi:predicted metallopeptidase